MLGTILIIVLILCLLGGIPAAGSLTQNWGHYPTYGLGTILLVIVVLMLLGRF